MIFGPGSGCIYVTKRQGWATDSITFSTYRLRQELFAPSGSRWENAPKHLRDRGVVMKSALLFMLGLLLTTPTFAQDSPATADAPGVSVSGASWRNDVLVPALYE